MTETCVDLHNTFTRIRLWWPDFTQYICVYGMCREMLYSLEEILSQGHVGMDSHFGLIIWPNKLASWNNYATCMEWRQNLNDKIVIGTQQRVGSQLRCRTCLVPISKDSRWMFFAAPPKQRDTKQSKVMSLLQLMQTSCAALWAARDLCSVCVGPRTSGVCVHVFLRLKSPLPLAASSQTKMTLRKWQSRKKKKTFIY